MSDSGTVGVVDVGKFRERTRVEEGLDTTTPEKVSGLQTTRDGSRGRNPDGV